MSRWLIVLPDDSARLILDAINHASKSLRIKMFLFSGQAILQTVIAAQKRGVSVRVMLNPARRSSESENEQTQTTLKSAGVGVLEGNPAFDLTQQKSMVVDDQRAFIMSFNWEPKDLTETRDYAVVTSASHEVAEVMECFDADWARKPFTPRPTLPFDLVCWQWAPTHRPVHRRGQTHFVAAKRALPGPGYHRTPDAGPRTRC